MTGLAIITIFGTTLTAATAKGGGRAEPARDTAQATVKATGQPVDLQARYWRQLAQKRLRLLGKRERRIVALEVTVHKLRAGQGPVKQPGRQPASVRSIICQVFGSQCSEALRVAWCESGYDVHATNGQYWGLFQFGSFARAQYGFGWDALTQARAAYRYFLAAGWSPWTCRP